MRLHPCHRRAFSLVELVLVIVILGIIGAIAAPRLSRANTGAAEAALAMNLSIVTKAVGHYKAEHGGAVPSSSDQLTKYTNFAGGTSDTPSTAYRYGPYLYKMPELTIGSNEGERDLTAAGTPGTDSDAGWWIDDETGDVRANLPDSDTTEDGTVINRLKPGDF